MKINKWTLGLAAIGLVSLASAAQAQEKMAPLAPLSGTVVSGYVDTSAYWNPGTGNANPAPFAFNQGKQDGFNLDIVDIKISKPLDESQWSAGYTAELVFGPDANKFEGNVRQAYVALHTPVPVGSGVDFKVGAWDSILGYESTDAYKNPNFTRSYGYSIAPLSNTGILAESKIAEWVAVAAGVANTAANLNNGINTRNPRAESAKAYMGSITLTAPETMGFLAGSALYAGVSDGFGSTTEDRTDIYVGATLATGLKGLQIGLAYDETYNRPGIGGSTIGNTSSYAGYVSFRPPESKFSFHARAEYATGSLGTLGTIAQQGVLNKVVALTGTIQYDLWQNVISRLEVRWDHACDGKEAFGGEGDVAAPTKKNDVMVAANIIYKF